MQSVKNKRKAAGTGGGKRSSPKATYSRNKTVGKDTTPQVEAAYNELTDQQKQAATSLGLSKEQATQIDERQANLINANVGSYDEAKKESLRQVYSNVTTDRFIRSGNSGLSKIALQEYKQSVQQKAAGTSVAVREAQRVIQRGSAESRATQLKSFNAETKKWEIPTQTLRNLNNTKIRTQGDWTAINNIATRNTLFGSSSSERERIQLARDYVIKNSSDPAKTRRVIAYNEMIATAKTPITGATTYAQAKEIQAAREKMLSEYSSIPDSGAKKGKVYKENVKAYFDWIDKQSFGTAQNMTVKKYMATHQFKTVDQQKQEATNKELEDFAGNSIIKGFVADLYKVTSTVDNLKSGEMSITDKNLKNLLPSRDVIAVKRDTVLQKAGLLKMQKKQQAYVKNDPALGALLTWTENKYDAVKTKPASVGVDVAKFAEECVFLGAAFKVAGLAGGSILSKVGSTGYKVSPKLVKKAADKAVSLKNKVPVAKRVTAKNLPEIAMGGYFGEQIARAGVSGAKVKDDKTGKYISFGEMEGSVYKNLKKAKKAGKDVNWVTEENIDLGAKLTAALPLFAAGTKFVTGKKLKIAKSPGKYKAALKIRKQAKASKIKKTTPTWASKSVTRMTQKEALEYRKKNLKALERHHREKNLEKIVGKKSVTEMSPAEVREYGRKQRELLEKRKSEKTAKSVEKLTGKKSVTDMSPAEVREHGRKQRELIEKRKAQNKAKNIKAVSGKKAVTEMTPEEVREYGRKQRALMKDRKAKDRSEEVERVLGKKSVTEMSPAEVREHGRKQRELLKNRKAQSKAKNVEQVVTVKKSVTEMSQDEARELGRARRAKMKERKLAKAAKSASKAVPVVDLTALDRAAVRATNSNKFNAAVTELKDGFKRLASDEGGQIQLQIPMQTVRTAQRMQMLYKTRSKPTTRPRQTKTMLTAKALKQAVERSKKLSEKLEVRAKQSKLLVPSVGAVSATGTKSVTRQDTKQKQVSKQKIRENVKQSTKQRTGEKARQDTKQKTRQETKQMEKQKAVQVQKQKQKQVTKQKQKQKAKTETRTKIAEKLVIPVLPLWKRQKLARYTASKKKIRTGHRVSKSTLGNLSSMFGDSEGAVSRKPKTKTRKTAKRRKR